MRIAVISDTHLDREIARIMLKAMGKIDLLVHAGDHFGDGVALAEELGLKLKGVAGNCDSPNCGFPEELVFTVNNYKIFLTHGHRYQVKRGIQRLYYRGLELGADIIIFGHTHVPIYIAENNLHILNPGSTALPRSANRKPSCATIDLTKEIAITIKEHG